MSRFRRVALNDLQTPKDGRLVYTNRWWAVTSEGEALFYCGENRRSNSPQCNVNREIVERMCPEGCRAIHVPIAYLDHDCHDYI